MKIAILAHNLRAGGGISVGQNIISAFGRIAPSHEYFISIPSGLGYEDKCEELSCCDVLTFSNGGNIRKRWLFDRFELPKAVKAWEPDIVLGLGNMALQGDLGIPQAVLLQNSYMLYGQKHYGSSATLLDNLKCRVLRYKFAKHLKSTKLLFCQTNTAANRVRDMYDFAGEIHICPNAVSETTKSSASVQMPTQLIPYKDKFKLFYLTRYYSHKNIEALLHLFLRHKDELSDCVAFITIADDHHPAAKNLLRKIDENNLHEHIINLGPIPQQELAKYYNSMDALVMPTLLESFSGSYLEAMHFDVPILTSDLDFAHEVCGDAAIYFDPWDVDSIKDSILKLKNNSALSRELVDKGRMQLRSKFISWDEIASNMLNEIGQILNK